MTPYDATQVPAPRYMTEADVDRKLAAHTENIFKQLADVLASQLVKDLREASGLQLIK